MHSDKKFPVAPEPSNAAKTKVIADKVYTLRELTLGDLVEVEAALMPATLATAPSKAAALLFARAANITVAEALALPIGAMAEVAEVLNGFQQPQAS